MTTETWTEEEQEIIDDSCYDEDVFEAARECDIEIGAAEEAYNGQHRNDEEFVEEMLEDIGDLPPDIPWYIHIDWKATARNVMMDYCESNGHYFRIF